MQAPTGSSSNTTINSARPSAETSVSERQAALDGPTAELARLQRENKTLRGQLQDTSRKHAAVRDGAEEAYQLNTAHIEELQAQLDVRPSVGLSSQQALRTMLAVQQVSASYAWHLSGAISAASSFQLKQALLVGNASRVNLLPVQATLGLWARSDEAEERLDAQQFKQGQTPQSKRQQAMSKVGTLHQKLASLRQQKAAGSRPLTDTAREQDQQQQQQQQKGEPPPRLRHRTLLCICCSLLQHCQHMFAFEVLPMLSLVCCSALLGRLQNTYAAQPEP